MHPFTRFVTLRRMRHEAVRWPARVWFLAVALWEAVMASTPFPRYLERLPRACLELALIVVHHEGHPPKPRPSHLYVMDQVQGRLHRDTLWDFAARQHGGSVPPELEVALAEQVEREAVTPSRWSRLLQQPPSFSTSCSTRSV